MAVDPIVKVVCSQRGGGSTAYLVGMDERYGHVACSLYEITRKQLFRYLGRFRIHDS